MSYLAIYIIIINLVASVIWCMDKYYAKRSLRRIPEKVLFWVAILGGSVGSLITMHSIRHKTRHWYFVIGIPLILFIQVAVAILIIKGV